MARQRTAAQPQLVRALLAEKTYPELLGLDVRDPKDWFPWFVAASLFAKPISASVARTTAQLLIKEGIRTPVAIERCGWDRLVTLLDLGGYVRYDFSTATKLLAIAATLRRDRIRDLMAGASSAKVLEEQLTTIKGVGPKTVAIFLRELRGVGGPGVPISREAKAAARRLHLGVRALELADLERSHLESVLVRIWVEHCKRGRWQGCPAGGRCGCAPATRVSTAVP